MYACLVVCAMVSVLCSWQGVKQENMVPRPFISHALTHFQENLINIKYRRLKVSNHIIVYYVDKILSYTGA